MSDMAVLSVFFLVFLLFTVSNYSHTKSEPKNCKLLTKEEREREDNSVFSKLKFAKVH